MLEFVTLGVRLDFHGFGPALSLLDRFELLAARFGFADDFDTLEQGKGELLVMGEVGLDLAGGTELIYKADTSQVASGDVSGALSLADARDVFEKRYLSRVLAETKGNVSRAAERLGLDRTTLHRKMKSLGLDGEKD